MYIGYMGDIVFSVSASHVLTPKDFSRESSARWSEHSLLLRKPVSQFGGAGLEKISFTVLLHMNLGVDPLKQLELLRKMRDTGAVFPLVIGGKPLTQNLWRLDSVKEGNFFFMGDGKIQCCEAALELTEYETGRNTERDAATVNYGGG